jgi:CRP-like cAMP-binding protein
LEEFAKKSETVVIKLFSVDDMTEIEERAKTFNITEREWVLILVRYTTVARLRYALPLLASRNPGRRFTHKELSSLVGSSREKVTKSLARLREQGEYADEITNCWGGR